ncbi:MAG: ABC transporter permease [Theionarchaea archaeon]|nr:ABC transporter permease [Theionarchaea archaeon]
MNVSRLFSMTRKDVVMTTRESFFFFMVFIPIIMSIVLSYALATMGTATPSLGILGEGEFVDILEEEPSIKVSIVSSEENLRKAVLEGEHDAGLIIPSDSDIAAGTLPILLISGKSLLNERLTIGATLVEAFREGAGVEGVVTIESRLIGTEEFSMKERFIPFILVYAAMIAAMILSASLIEEREFKTLNAVLVTPITPLEVILAKSLYGLFLGMILGILILVLNSSLTGGIHLILFFLILGTLFAVGIGLMAGAVMKDITDLISRMKLLGFFFMIPALVILFPQIPQWIGKFFPTYYFIHPLLVITQKGAGWSDVWWEAVVMIIIDVVVLYATSRVLRKRMLGKAIRF